MLEKGNQEDLRVERRVPLLRKLDIPVEHLDFRYVEDCKDVKELEKILRVLRSGEEGHYPQLIKVTEECLRKFDPNNRHLRVELPVIRSKYLEKDEQNDILQDLENWVDVMSVPPPLEASTSCIFSETFAKDVPTEDDIPIRGLGKKIKKHPQQGTSASASTSSRIKSWEYDKWDKFDVEAELNRLDVQGKQVEEWEKYVQPKIAQSENDKVTKLMKNMDSCEIRKETKAPEPNERPRTGSDPSKPSFIEEISEPGTSKQMREEIQAIKKQPTIPEKGKRRRIRVEIEDVNIGW